MRLNGDPAHHAIIALAGPAASKRWRGDDWQDGQHGDFERAARHIDEAAGELYIGTYATHRTTIALRVRREAEQLIERHWNDVMTLAGGLLEARTLTGGQVERVLRTRCGDW